MDRFPTRPSPGSLIPDALTVVPSPPCPEDLCDGTGWLTTVLAGERCVCATPEPELDPVYDRHPRPSPDADRWEWIQWETDRAAERAERERERRGY